VATTGAGKSLIKDMLGPTAVTVMGIIKSIIESKDDKKKANEIENIVIRIGVKVILLFNNKDITAFELRKCLPLIKQIWSDALDFCEMSFSYNPDAFQNVTTELEQMIKDIIRPFVSDKTLNRLSDCFNYFKDRDFLDALYLNEQNRNLKEQLSDALRAQWDKVFDPDERK